MDLMVAGKNNKWFFWNLISCPFIAFIVMRRSQTMERNIIGITSVKRETNSLSLFFNFLKIVLDT